MPFSSLAYLIFVFSLTFIAQLTRSEKDANKEAGAIECCKRAGVPEAEQKCSYAALAFGGKDGGGASPMQKKLYEQLRDPAAKAKLIDKLKSNSGEYKLIAVGLQNKVKSVKAEEIAKCSHKGRDFSECCTKGGVPSECLMLCNGSERVKVAKGDVILQLELDVKLDECSKHVPIIAECSIV